MAFQRKKPSAIGIKAAFPGFIEPALATSIEKVPTGDRWLHEIKFDGYRVQVHLANEAVKIYPRRGNDWTKRFRKIADDAWPSTKIALVAFDLLFLNGYDLAADRAKQVKDVVVKYLKDNPADHHLAGIALAYRAFYVAFDCKPKPNTN